MWLFLFLEVLARWTITVLSCLTLMSCGHHADNTFAAVWLLAVPGITAILLFSIYPHKRLNTKDLVFAGILMGPLGLVFSLCGRLRDAGRRGDGAAAIQVLWIFLVFMGLLSARTPWLEWSAYLCLFSSIWYLAITVNLSPFLFHISYCSMHAKWLLSSKVARLMPVGVSFPVPKGTELGGAFPDRAKRPARTT